MSTHEIGRASLGARRRVAGSSPWQGGRPTVATPDPSPRRPGGEPGGGGWSAALTGRAGRDRALGADVAIAGPVSPATRVRRLVGQVELESGAVLPQVDVAYRTWGTLAANGANAVLICHALTGSADADVWWSGLFGPGRALDPSRDFIVASNVLGGCYGSTGPLAAACDGLPAWGPDFPAVTIRDQVRVQAALLEELGVRRLKLVLGGSLGGMLVLEWAAMYPDRIDAIAPLAVSGRHSAWCIAISAAQRAAITADPKWREGRYPLGDPPAGGLAAARMMAMVTYRARGVFEDRFGRSPSEQVAVPTAGANPADGPNLVAVEPSRSGERAAGGGDGSHEYWSWAAADCDGSSLSARVDAPRAPFAQPGGSPASGRFAVEAYLARQGAKLVARFDANSYVGLTRAMDSHDLGRGRGRYEDVLRSIRLPALVVAIDSDVLYPPYEQRELASLLPCAELAWLRSPHGHDAFLLETAQLDRLLVDFRQRVEAGGAVGGRVVVGAPGDHPIQGNVETDTDDRRVTWASGF